MLIFYKITAMVNHHNHPHSHHNHNNLELLLLKNKKRDNVNILKYKTTYECVITYCCSLITIIRRKRRKNIYIILKILPT